ncbi:metal-sensitive transcriptional regulator [Alicyclobacillus fastidiosus]|uniref:Metal-sensitive transcriptional regulator n=1 Tax=Alicyclobacillus fastidiosus TaxID=392011 RepID=A0ABV5ALU2_9BACL|nr:metal-sensitive transcriptional regulator [Alicyclobacillus fastidiosus]WEH11069.1 metal-sensitive transcriptional regulator [Alicyclobacillus fastidiosus]
MTHSYSREKPDLLARLRRIEGQIRGVQKMLDEDRYCIDVLTQLSAIKQATHAVALSVLQAHTRGCVASAIRDEYSEEDKITELMEVIRQFTK